MLLEIVGLWNNVKPFSRTNLNLWWDEILLNTKCFTGYKNCCAGISTLMGSLYFDINAKINCFKCFNVCKYNLIIF